MAAKKKIVEPPAPVDLIPLAQALAGAGVPQTDGVDPGEQLEPATDGQLKLIAELAQEQVRLESDAAKAADMVKAINADWKQVAEVDLPEAMGRIGMKEFTLDSGEAIIIGTAISAGITKANQPDAFDWLDDNDAGDLIKKTVTVEFGKGQGELAAEVYELIRKHLPDIKITMKEGVNAASLGAYVREQIAAGNEDLPEDLLGVFRYRRATVIPAGKKPASTKRKSEKVDEL